MTCVFEKESSRSTLLTFSGSFGSDRRSHQVWRTGQFPLNMIMGELLQSQHEMEDCIRHIYTCGEGFLQKQYCKQIQRAKSNTNKASYLQGYKCKKIYPIKKECKTTISITFSLKKRLLWKQNPYLEIFYNPKYGSKRD